MSQPSDTPLRAESQPPPAAPDISADQALSWLDWAVVSVVVAVALWYLYRKLWARRGDCAGCAKGKAGCAVQRATRRAQADSAIEVAIDRIHRRH